MKSWKKIAIGSLSTVILLIAGWLTLLNYSLSELCTTIVVDQFLSPGKKLKAVVFQIDCGATTGFNSHVAVVSANIDLSQNREPPKSLFTIDSNHGQAPEGKEHGPEVQIHWLSDSHLEIGYHRLAHVIRSEKSAQGIVVSYRTFPSTP